MFIFVNLLEIYCLAQNSNYIMDIYNSYTLAVESRLHHSIYSVLITISNSFPYLSLTIAIQNKFFVEKREHITWKMRHRVISQEFVNRKSFHFVEGLRKNMIVACTFIRKSLTPLHVIGQNNDKCNSGMLTHEP